MTNPSVSDVRAFIINTVRRDGPSSDPRENTNLLEAGIVDSLGFVELIAAIQSHFGIEVDLLDADPDDFLTVDGLARCAVGSAQGGPGAPSA